MTQRGNTKYHLGKNDPKRGAFVKLQMTTNANERCPHWYHSYFTSNAIECKNKLIRNIRTKVSVRLIEVFSLKITVCPFVK